MLTTEWVPNELQTTVLNASEISYYFRQGSLYFLPTDGTSILPIPQYDNDHRWDYG